MPQHLDFELLTFLSVENVVSAKVLVVSDIAWRSISILSCSRCLQKCSLMYRSIRICIFIVVHFPVISLVCFWYVGRECGVCIFLYFWCVSFFNLAELQDLWSLTCVSVRACCVRWCVPRRMRSCTDFSVCLLFLVLVHVFSGTIHFFLITGLVFVHAPSLLAPTMSNLVLYAASGGSAQHRSRSSELPRFGILKPVS